MAGRARLPGPGTGGVEVGLGYATRTYRLRPGAMDGDQLILTAGTPANPRAGFLAATEGGRHMLSIGGMCGNYPPTDPDGFDAFVAALPSGDIAAAHGVSARRRDREHVARPHSSRARTAAEPAQQPR